MVTTEKLLETFNIPTKWINQLKLLPQETVFTEIELNGLLDEYRVKLNPQSRIRIQEAAAIVFYHQQSTIPVIKTLLCDDAPQFKLLTSLVRWWVESSDPRSRRIYLAEFYRLILDNNSLKLV